MSKSVFVTIQTDRDIPFIRVRGPITTPLAMSATMVKDLRSLGFNVQVQENVKLNVLGQRVISSEETSTVVEEVTEPVVVEEVEEETTEDTVVEEVTEPAEIEDTVTEEVVAEDEDEFLVYDEETYNSWTKAKLLEYITEAIEAKFIEDQGNLSSKTKAALVQIIVSELL